MEEIQKIETKIHPLNHLFTNQQHQSLKPYMIKDRPKNEIKFLTFNTQMIPAATAIFNNKYPTGSINERCLDICNSLGAFDIVCFQEVFGGMWSEIRELMLSYTMKAGFLYRSMDPEIGYDQTHIMDGGVLIISRFPIVKTSHCGYSYSNDLDGAAHRGVVYARIQVGESFMNVFSTHMCASHFLPPETAPSSLTAALINREIQV